MATINIPGGATLSGIAQQYKTTVQNLLTLNPQIKDPNLIYAGAQLIIPDQTAQTTTQPQTLNAGQPAAPQTIPGVQLPVPQQEIPEKTSRQLIDEAYQKYGISDLIAKISKRPEKTFEEIYQSAYTSSGLAENKNKIEEVNQQLTKLTAGYNETVGNINDDPFLSEAIRSGRIAKATEIYDRKKAAIVNQLSLLTNQFERGKDDVRDFATRVLSEFYRERGVSEDVLNIALKRAELEAESQIKEKQRIQESQRPFELSPGQERFIYNPKTKKYEAVAKVSPRKRASFTEPYTISTGETVQRNKETGEIRVVFRPKGRTPGKRYTASDIPAEDLNDLLYDINQGATLEQLYKAYPETSPALVQSIYYNR